MAKCFAVLCLLCGLAVPLTAVAQVAAPDYPVRTIKIVVPYVPGGPTDLLARMYGNYLDRKYSHPVVVENRPGGGQLLGADYVAKAPPDGYTLLTGARALAYESLLNKDATLNTARDILPYAIFAGGGLYVAVQTGLQVSNMAEFIAWVKAHPGKLDYGTAGQPLVAMEGMRVRLGLDWVVVNYKGGTAANAALMAGQVGMYTPGRRRDPALPDVPTVAESGIGLPDFDLTIWLGMYAPAGVPMDVLGRLNSDAVDMAGSPEAAPRLNAMGWKPMPLDVPGVRRDSAAAVEEVSELLAKGVKLR